MNFLQRLEVTQIATGHFRDDGTCYVRPHAMGRNIYATSLEDFDTGFLQKKEIMGVGKTPQKAWEALSKNFLNIAKGNHCLYVDSQKYIESRQNLPDEFPYSCYQLKSGELIRVRSRDNLATFGAPKPAQVEWYYDLKK